MSGNNPNLSYALNVLGNASVQGILDCTEVAIDNVDTENIETHTATIQGVSTTSAPVLTVSSASTTATSIATFLAPAAAASITIGASLNTNQSAEIQFGSGALNLGLYGQSPALSLNGSGDASVLRNLSVTGTTTSGGMTVSKSGTGTVIVSSLLAPSSTTAEIVLGQVDTLSQAAYINVSAGVLGFGIRGGSTVISMDSQDVTFLRDVNVTRNLTAAQVNGSASGTGAVTISNLLAPAATTTALYIGNAKLTNQCADFTFGNGVMAMGFFGQNSSLTFNGSGDVTVGRTIKSTINTARYTLSAPMTWLTSSLTTVVNWVIDNGKSKGTALGYAAGVFTNDTGSDIVATVSWTTNRDTNILGASTYYIVANGFNYAIQKVSGLDNAALSATFLVPSSETIRLQGFQDSGDTLAFSTSVNMLCITYYPVN
jgi:hypothetical protein